MAVTLTEQVVHSLEIVKEEEIAAPIGIVFETILEQMGPLNSTPEKAMQMVPPIVQYKALDGVISTLGATYAAEITEDAQINAGISAIQSAQTTLQQSDFALMQIQDVSMACPMLCTIEIVSVAQRFGWLSRRSRGCGKVGSVLCFPLFHAPGMFRSATLPALEVCNPARSVA